MIGFCDENGEKIIINQHYPKGSLSMHLSDPKFVWEKRKDLVWGVVNAIIYLHDMETRSYYVIHRNINSSTILLDKNWKPMLSGFEFSIKRLVDRKNQVFLCGPLGTRGYIDPTTETNGGVTHKSDMYSLGVVLFEILCGRKANEDGRLLVPLVFKEEFKKLVHPNRLSEKQDEASYWWFSMIKGVAYSCLHEDHGQRPSASEIPNKLMGLSFDSDNGYEYDRWSLKQRGAYRKYPVIKRVPPEPWKIDNLEHLRIELTDIKTANYSHENNIIKFADYEYIHYKVEVRCYDREYISLDKRNNEDELPKRDYNAKMICVYYDKNYNTKPLQILSRCHHRNIESFLGYSDSIKSYRRKPDDEFFMFLFFELLDSAKYLSDHLDSYMLTWEKRLKICIDVAHGLRYLHDEIDDQTMVIHNDIKCSNIMFDDDSSRAQISGLERLESVPMDVVQRMRKQNCQVDIDLQMGAEYARLVKMDVIGFGLFMYEIMCSDSLTLSLGETDGERDQRLAHTIEKAFKGGSKKRQIRPALMNANSQNNFFLHVGPNEDSLDTFIETIRWCLVGKQNLNKRPTMNDVIKELKKALAFHENSRDNFKMSFQDIKMATQNFSNEIGGGGFGSVYKGEVSNGHKTIVAKKLDTSYGQGEKQYYTELEILYVYKHENIIGLEGYSRETDEKIIVYEYAARGSLDRHLKSASLTWRNRLKICIDAANGLEFLHGGVEGQVVIHRDIKAANILLFSDWKAKLGDFGLSIISAIDKETDYVIDHPCGTESYVDPLYRKLGLLTLESDIYSFGVVLFEILCGRTTYAIIPRDWSLSVLDFVKLKFEGKKDEMVFKAIKDEIVPESLTTFLNLIYKCLDGDRKSRPTSKEVLTELNKALKFQNEHRILEPITA
ncbi:uncharacterized protein [Rutidosis leptorrhynchoides]|uniref:uncharacterized protein n=1 Tax=Rutidosis leptorrhynchoides TaxID=125765 RepID=UPI003A996E4E